jgi:hypothetical protein
VMPNALVAISLGKPLQHNNHGRHTQMPQTHNRRRKYESFGGVASSWDYRDRSSIESGKESRWPLVGACRGRGQVDGL